MHQRFVLKLTRCCFKCTVSQYVMYRGCHLMIKQQTSGFFPFYPVFAGRSSAAHTETSPHRLRCLELLSLSWLSRIKAWHSSLQLAVGCFLTCVTAGLITMMSPGPQLPLCDAAWITPQYSGATGLTKRWTASSNFATLWCKKSQRDGIIVSSSCTRCCLKRLGLRLQIQLHRICVHLLFLCFENITKASALHCVLSQLVTQTEWKEWEGRDDQNFKASKSYGVFVLTVLTNCLTSFEIKWNPLFANALGQRFSNCSNTDGDFLVYTGFRHSLVQFMIQFTPKLILIWAWYLECQIFYEVALGRSLHGYFNLVLHKCMRCQQNTFWTVNAFVNRCDQTEEDSLALVLFPETFRDVVRLWCSLKRRYLAWYQTHVHYNLTLCWLENTVWWKNLLLPYSTGSKLKAYVSVKSA